MNIEGFEECLENRQRSVLRWQSRTDFAKNRYYFLKILVEIEIREVKWNSGMLRGSSTSGGRKC